MKKIWIVVILSLLIFSTIVLTKESSENSPTLKAVSFEEFVSVRDNEIDRLAFNNPDSLSSVYISFRTFIPANDVKTIIQKYNLEVLEVFHGWQEYRGGAKIKKEIPFEENIKNLEYKVKVVSERFILSVSKIIDELNDPARKKSYENALMQEQEYLNNLELIGITIYGLKAKSIASSLKELKDHNPDLIRFIDFTENCIFPGAISPLDTPDIPSF